MNRAKLTNGTVCNNGFLHSEAVLVSTVCRIALAFTVMSVSGLFGCGQSQDSLQSVATTSATKAVGEFDKLRKMAEGGDAKAQHELAVRLDKGDGVERDAVKAFEWFVKAAQAGSIESMVEVVERAK